MNKTCLTGRITKDIELRYTTTNVAVTQFTLAVTRNFKNSEGKYDTDFINCVCYGISAETMKKYLNKGDLIGVTGRIQTRSYENKEGKKVYVTEVIAETIEFLQQKNKKEEIKEEPKKEKLSDEIFADFGKEIDISDDDIAF